MTATTFNESAPDYQLDVDFNALTVFDVGSDIPSGEEISGVMASADYGDFIQNYIWGQTEGPFLGTTAVQYSEQN